MITLERRGRDKYNLIHNNGMLVGRAIRSNDGFFKFWPRGMHSWTTDTIREIADKVDALNQEWQQQMIDDLKKTRPPTAGGLDSGKV